LRESDSHEYHSQFRAAVGRRPKLIELRADGDVLSIGHPAVGNGLLEMLIARMSVADVIEHAVVYQKRYRHRTRREQGRFGDREIDGVTKVFRGVQPHANRWPLSCPSPRGGVEPCKALDKVCRGVLIRHIDDRRRPVCFKILQRPALHRRCERPGHIPARAGYDHHAYHRQPSLHSRYYNPASRAYPTANTSERFAKPIRSVSVQIHHRVNLEETMYLKRILLLASFSIALHAQVASLDTQKVVATVAGKEITAADIMRMLSSFDTQTVKAFQDNPQYIVSQYFLFVHLADEAEKAKLLEKSPYKEQFEGLRMQLLRNARLNEENNTFPVSSAMIDSYYKQHAAQYEQAKIKVIYISYNGQAPATGTGVDAMKAAAQNALAAAQSKHSEPEARALASDVVRQLRAGADFAKLVEQYSEDATSKAAGGDFGVIKAVSEYPAELKSAVFALKAGDISEPIRQPTAYYVIRVEEKGSQPLEEVREPIVQALRNEHMNLWMKDMNSGYQAVIKDSDFFKTFAAPAQPGTIPGALPAAPPKP
jgi:peptidyl-prolyl cis-trans isomerase C